MEWDKDYFFDDVVLKVFKHSCSAHIISMTSKARLAAARPLWMAENIWNELWKRWNECPKFKQRSETNKRSRAVATELGTPPYAGGSISMSAHKQKLVCI